VYVTQSFHDNNIIPTYSIHSYDMQSACFRALGANGGKLEKKYMVIDHVMLETLAKVRVRESKILFHERFAKVGY